MKQKICLAIFSLSMVITLAFCLPVRAETTDNYSQIINLEPGWNIISTPRVVESYTFSVPETLANFSILVLDSSGSWTAMQGIGQDNFVPLYGYFINNKTSENQTLTFNYLQDLDPSQRLFDRQLSVGWNLLGIANPSYALKQNSNGTSNNVSSILGNTRTCLTTVGDFTFGNSNKFSVYAGNNWSFKDKNDLYTLNNWRETKAYGVYVPYICNYVGFQDNDSINTSTTATAHVNFDTTTKTPKVGDVNTELASFDITQTVSSSRDIILKSIKLKNTGSEDMSNTLDNVYLEKDGSRVSNIGTIDGLYITFTLENNGLLIEKNNTASIKVRGAILAKEKSSDISFIFSLNNIEDITIVEDFTDFSVTITKNNGVSSVNIIHGGLTLSKDTYQYTDHTVDKGELNSGALLANIRADEAILAEGVNVEWIGADVTSSFQNAKIYLNGSLLGSFNPASDIGAKEIESPITFNKGDNELRITVDTKSNAISSANIKFFITAANFLHNPNESPEYIASGNSVLVEHVNGNYLGPILTVNPVALEIYDCDGYSDSRNIVHGGKDVVLGSFLIGEARNDNVSITSIEASANIAEGIRMEHTAVYDIKIFVDGVQVSSTRDFNENGASFSGLNININKNQYKSFEVKASFELNATGTIATTLTFHGQDSRGKDIEEKTIDTIEQTVINADAGILTISNDPSFNDPTPITDEISQVLVVPISGTYEERFFLKSQEDMSNITEITIVNSSTLAYDNMVSSAKIYVNNIVAGIGYVSNKSITFVIVPNTLIVKNEEAVSIYLEIIFNPIERAEQSGSIFRPNLTNIKYKGSPGIEITKSMDFYCRSIQIQRTLPVFRSVNLSSEGNQQDQEEILSFGPSNDYCYPQDYSITKLVFNKFGSQLDASTTDFYLYEGEYLKYSVTSTDNAVVFENINLVVINDNLKSYTIKANTMDITNGKTFGLFLEKSVDNGNVLWEEYFDEEHGGNKPYNAKWIYNLPFSNVKLY